MTGEPALQPDPETVLRPGQIVGDRYRVDHLIASGGMAAVWAGTNQRTGKRVALKVILRSFAATPDARELFRREALAASRVNHPNVVNVFDVIDHEGMSCVVMELLTGEPLSTYLARNGFLSVEEAVTLLLPSMRGVAEANAQGVVHRDLKPQNIFICIGPDGRLLTTKILDFGIAVVAEKAVDKETSTAPVTLIGTPSYMSPEHIAGKTDIDERADVYGFGVILFEALTGHVPFPGEPTPALFMRILSQSPPKVTEYRPDLPPAITTIIDRALAKSPEDRFPTLNHLIFELEKEILHRSPLPRSLTPMVGVALLESGAGSSGLADPVVQVARQSEASGGHAANPTRALYLMSPSAKPTAAAPHRRTTGPVVRFLFAVGAFVGALAFMVWVALPRLPTQRLIGSLVPGAASNASAAPPHPVAVLPSSAPPSRAVPAAVLSAPTKQPASTAPDPERSSTDVPGASVGQVETPTLETWPSLEPAAKHPRARTSSDRVSAGRGRSRSRGLQEDRGGSLSPASSADQGLVTDSLLRGEQGKTGPLAAIRGAGDARSNQPANSGTTQAMGGSSGLPSTRLSTTPQTGSKADTLSAEDF
jgi:eukaryotic-like serine/threonine-protein kinase